MRQVVIPLNKLIVSTPTRKKIRRLIFDLETEPFSDEFRHAVTDSDRLRHAPRMRVACVFDETRNRHRFYAPDDAHKLISALLCADEIVSFNGKRFDLLVLQRHFGSWPDGCMLNHIDLHEILTEKSGFRVSLNEAVRVNFGERKHTSGRDMHALSLEELKIACRADVEHTYRLWQRHADGTLLVPQRGGTDWVTPEQRRRVRGLFEFEEPLEYDPNGRIPDEEFKKLGQTVAWSRERDDALQIRGREIWTFVQAMRWLKSLPPEEREGAIAEMESEVELLNANDIEPDIFEVTGVEPRDGIFCALDVLSRWNSD